MTKAPITTEWIQSFDGKVKYLVLLGSYKRKNCRNST